MWQLENIKATNLCAFRELDYTFNQGCTTLVFGNNMDDDSQNSNGSGKSALIEAIAISITGETLRKVNMDEIINDSCDTATLEAVLSNASEGMIMIIDRKLTRKKPQTVSITINRSLSGNSGEVSEVKQSSVTEYNKYILETIGLEKDDIFSNFILTAKKYRSFLSSPDKEKKEIINRFSNGILVDESIAALYEDMGPVQEELSKSEIAVGECTGKVSALGLEIERVIAESADRSAHKRERIQRWNEAIAEKRGKIRELNKNCQETQEKIRQIDTLDLDMQQLEKSDSSLQDMYSEIKKSLNKYGLDPIGDYANKFAELTKSVSEYKDKIDAASDDSGNIGLKLKSATKNFEKLSKTYNKDLADINLDLDNAAARIKELAVTVRSIQSNEVSLNRKRSGIYAAISELKTLLAGKVTCPKCKHEFLLSSDKNIDELKEQLSQYQNNADTVNKEVDENKRQYEDCVADGKNARQNHEELLDKKSQIKQDFQKSSMELNDLKDRYDKAQYQISKLSMEIERLTNSLNNLKRSMFDEVFDLIDEYVRRCNVDLKGYELDIAGAEGVIKSYEDSIVEIENSAETDVTESLRKSKARYEKELSQAIEHKESVERKFNEFKVQESTFIEFKTHLANTKIDAISKITNDFLETIGSDIRVAFSGYTVLKSGKVRDKISISLMRDGLDCGSFDKFSRGEQTRVELACILAMHELTNLNCKDGHGLNLLVIDEILDAADEQGLTNVFKALNETHVTSLVVSHGNIAENYPNRLIINKQNGVSFI